MGLINRTLLFRSEAMIYLPKDIKINPNLGMCFRTLEAPQNTEKSLIWIYIFPKLHLTHLTQMT